MIEATLRVWQAIRNGLSALRSSVETNLRVCSDQWALYRQEVKFVILPGIRHAPLHRKPHKAFAFVEEWFDKCPRINAYLLPPLFVVAVVL